METIGKLIFGLGAFLMVTGLVLWLLGDKLSWLGHLPGDIRVEGDNYSFYMPITTMIIISVALSLLLSVIARLFR